jgi:hypothetical protein
VPRLMAAASSSSEALATAQTETAMQQQAQPGTQNLDAAALDPQLATDDADGTQPAAAQHAAASLPGYLHRWNVLRKAAVSGIASVQQALPLQPRFVHFGNYCVLTRLTRTDQQAETHTSAHAQPTAAW